eukprot:s9177_g2.t1
MGAFASSPIDAVRVERRTSQGSCKWRTAVAEMQGWRITHEDLQGRVTCATKARSPSQHAGDAHFLEAGHEGSASAFFGVLDGHGGKKAAWRLCAAQLSCASQDFMPVVLCATVEKFGPSAATPWLKVVLGFFSESCACFANPAKKFDQFWYAARRSPL